jgi:outer membrane receptor protein involved in Fe transport
MALRKDHSLRGPLFFTLAASFLVFPARGGAQLADESGHAASADEVIEEIVVTGTRIKRRDFVTPSPLATLNREDLLMSGQATIAESLNRIPQVVPVSGRAPDFMDFSANVDLRGLGPGRSLVMLNGRRVAPTGIDNAVDVNNIPQFLIERVEIITGGTSAVYGSDAIAGVINFITRKDYEGFGVDAGVSMSSQGDAESRDINLSFGHNFSNGRGNVSFYAGVIDREPLNASERELTSVPCWDDWEGGLVCGGSWSTPAGVVRWPLVDFGNGPEYVTFDPDGRPEVFNDDTDTFNYLSSMYLQMPLDQISVGTFAHYDISERFEAYVEASHIRNEPTTQAAATPAWANIEVNLDNPGLTPEARQLFADQFACAPNLACLDFSNRFTALGPRVVDHEQEYTRIVVGLTGEPWDDWTLDGWISYTEGSSLLNVYNDASRSRYLQGLLVDPLTNECFDPSGGCVPLNVFGEGNLSQAGADFIRMAPHQSLTEQSQELASAFVSGPLFATWAGPADIAVGVEWRRDETEFKPDEVLFTGEALSWPADTPVSGTNEVYEYYAEAVIPLASELPWARYLGLEFGGRYSDYNHAGDVQTYKTGAEWEAIDGLSFRAMYQRSTRAPNSRELFEEQTTFNWWLVWWETSEDPCSASADPVAAGNREKCIVQGLPADQVGVFEATLRYPVGFLSGGNTNLKPEIGKTWTAGVVWSPLALPDWAIAVDFFSLEVEDTIGDVDPYQICFDPNNVGNVFCDAIVRDETGNVSHISELTNNRGLMETTGIDTQIQYRADLPDALGIGNHSADIGVHLYWTHMLTNREQENPVTPVLECAGYFGWPCDSRAAVLPRNRVMANIHYQSGPLGMHLHWRWIDGTRNAAPMRSFIFGVPDPELGIPEIDEQHYVDAGLDYQFGDHLSASLSINNVFDNDPPRMEQQFNTDTGLYDVFGRSYTLRLSVQY